MAHTFEIRGRNFVAVLTDLPKTCQSKYLYQGGVYSGSSVLAYVHNTFEPNDVDVYFDEITTPHDDNKTCCDYGDNMDIVLNVRRDSSSQYKTDIVTTTICRDEIVESLQNYFDWDKCASRIYVNAYTFEVELAIPIDQHMDPLSKHMFWNVKLQHSLTYDVEQRYKKYKSRGFIMDQAFLELYKCGICYDVTFNTTQCCNKHVHSECYRKWKTYSIGEEMTESKCTCPFCKAWIAVELYRAINFNKWKIMNCVICANLFPQEREGGCEAQANNNALVVCTPCLKKLDPNTIVPGQKFTCPNCSDVSEFKGGCQMLACCLYGYDKCKKDCDHGKFGCGYKWKFTRKDLYTQ